MTRKQKLQIVAAAVAVSAGAVQSFAASPVVVYQDNFDNRTDLNTNVNTSPYTYQYTVSNAGFAVNDDGAVLTPGGSGSNTLKLTNDLTAAANKAGVTEVSTPISGYTNGFNSTFSSNTGKDLVWTLNIQNNTANPSGFAVSGSGNTGQAYILGSTNSDFFAAGAQGYAILIGQTGGNPDPIRLYRFDNGLNAIGTGSPSNTAGKSLAAGPGAGTDYFSVQVTLDTSTNTWSLSTRDDGAAGFADPTSPTGYNSAGAGVVDSTYTTSPLNYSGFEISHNTATFNALYDNLQLQLQDIPVGGTPRNLLWDPSGAGGASDGSGTWGATNIWYDPGASALATWADINPDNATFGSGSGTGAATVTLSTSHTAGMVTFAANSPTYTLTGSNLSINGFTVGTNLEGIIAQQSATINSGLIWAANARMQVNGASTVVRVNGALAGGGAIGLIGTGTLVLNTPSPAFSGGIGIGDFVNPANLTVTSTAGGISGFGTGTATVRMGGTLFTDASGGDLSFTSASGTIVMEDQGTWHVKGNVTWSKNYIQFDNPTNPADTTGGPADPGTTLPVSSTIHVDAGGTLLFKSQIRNDRSSVASLHTIHLDGPGTVKLTNSGSDGAGDASLFAGSWDLSNGTLILGQNTETGGSSGDTLNALGFKAGDSSLGNTVTVRGTGVLVGTENTPNPTSGTINAYKAAVIMSGGTLASGNGKDTNWGGPFTTTAATTSTIAVYDPTNPTVARNLSLTFGPGGALIQEGDTTWSGNVVIDPGTTTGGSFILNRDSGSMISVTPGVSITVNAGAGLQDIGPTDNLSDGTNSVNVVNNSNVTGFVVDGGITKNVGTLDGTGSTTIAASTALNTNHIIQSSVTLHGSAAVREDANQFGSNAGTSKITTLAMDPTSKLDLTNNKLILGNAIGSYNGSQYTGVLGQVQSGRNGGTWDGPGILTSESSATAAGSFLTTLAVASAADVKHISGATTATFGGQTVHATDTLVMYTFAGDANLSGHIDADDYFQIDSHYNKNGTNSAISYINGDFNYDGVINGDDYFLIDSNYAAQGGNSFSTSEPLSLGAGVSAVPEPASLAMLGLATAGLFGRRRRQR